LRSLFFNRSGSSSLLGRTISSLFSKNATNALKYRANLVFDIAILEREISVIETLTEVSLVTMKVIAFP